MTLLPTAESRRVRRAVADLVMAHKGTAAWALVTLVGATAVGLGTAPVLGHIVDLVADGREPSSLAVPVALLLAIAALSGLGHALGVAGVARLGESVVADLRERFVARALRLPLERVELAGSGDLTSRVTGDVTVVTRAVRDAFPRLAQALFTIVLTLGALALLDWRFLAAVLLAVPVQTYSLRRYLKLAAPVYDEHRRAVGVRQHRLLDTISGARTVRAFGLADEHTRRVGDASQRAADLAVAGLRLATRLFSLLNLAEFIGLAGVLITGYWLVGQDMATIGTATAAALYFHNLFNPINTAIGLADEAQKARAALARMIGVCDLPAEEESDDHPAPDGSLSLTGVGHAYRPGLPVLSDVDLEVAPGERVALVGASGAGKSTLAKLVAGIHPAAEGSLRVGGLDLAVTGPIAARHAVTLISQEVHVFAGPLADDLRLARPDATDEELGAALETVGALDWVRALPEGTATVVGTGGHKLTAAQAQQVALARLVLADRPIAVLDEATADAGSAGARRLEVAATRALEGRTGLVVAHRLTQVAEADRVVVLEGGRVVESGPHEELVRAEGPYAELWKAWSARR
ncbi:ABC transporter ATP-binding protein [Nocardiopsis sp. NRRL B-16309]|uniref:ABC transporter ATP-binding protein n=1 Tax=Nocardiopsis sp. NRRL B-16309 TaxID=1519494 RepID=UPI0006AE3EF0|nr:ABC transporter ATP-binding protein [Nocardiopsis sp. NRRL B-16309]KOX17038.1 multidrug ABC transporter permease [Nocardiopsis sp. NRRL B-16309]